MNLSTAYLELEQKTLQQGELIGEQRGEQRGEIKGEQKIIITQLNWRIGEIQPRLIEQIRKLSVEHLEELAKALLDFSTVDDLQQWLNSRPESVE
jgi:predicted transposase YdaD